MKVYFVGAGPGDPELLTIKAKRLLENARICIYAGSLIHPSILEILPEDARKIDSAAMNLNELETEFLRAQARNIDVVRLHSGDPSIYGAIREQIATLDRAGIAYEVVPGVSSFQASAAALGAELTLPEVSQTIILTRISGKTPVPETQSLENLARTQATLCLFLSVHEIGKIVESLSPYYGKDCPAAVVHHASWPDQTIIRASLESICEKTQDAGINKTAMIIVGPALTQSGPVSRLYDKDFVHGYREGTHP